MGYKWNNFIARVTNRLRYSDKRTKEEKLRCNTFRDDGICIFCKLAHGDNLIYEDQDFVFFKDIKEDATFHMLAVPKEHIRNINELQLCHVEMIEKMLEIGRKILQEQFGSRNLIFGFHHPPRNSIDHLHMHCIVGPFKKFKSKLSYSSYLWFITPDQVIKKIIAESRSSNLEA